MFKRVAALLATSLMLCSAVAQAEQYKFDFSATGAWITSHQKPSPDSEVSGSLIFTAASLHDTPTSVDAVSMVLDGHSYSLSEIGMSGYGYGTLSLYGTLFGSGMGSGMTDFYIYANSYASDGILSFASPSHSSSFWESTSFTSTYTPLAAVPEADTYAMLLAGLGLIGVLARRRNNQA